MMFQITYDPDYKRTMFATLVDNRANIPDIKNQIGIVIKQYVDAQTALVTDKVIPYKVERADIGVLVGYFLLKVNIDQSATNIQEVIRPAFQSFTEITQFISDWILAGNYVFDILL